MSGGDPDKTPEKAEAASSAFDLDAASASLSSKMGRVILSEEDLLVLTALSIRGSSTFMERGYK